MADVKTFVRSNNTATVICPACNTAKIISAEPYRNKKHAIKIRCHCGEVFTLRLEFRRHYRKPTDLAGTYSINIPTKSGGGVIHIRNISRGGIGFTLSGSHHIEQGMSIVLEFQLNDKHMSQIRKEVTVCAINGNYIGCKFSASHPLERALGFFLQR